MESKAKLFWLQNETICQYHMHQPPAIYLYIYTTQRYTQLCTYTLYVRAALCQLFFSLFSSLPQIFLQWESLGKLESIELTLDGGSELWQFQAPICTCTHTHTTAPAWRSCECALSVCVVQSSLFGCHRYTVLLLLPKEEKKYQLIVYRNGIAPYCW